MKPSTEFKRAIREGRINDAFVIAMGNAPKLHITTWIADSESEPAKPNRGDCLSTHVNLIEGEIVNEIGEDLIADNLYGTLQQFHSHQVTQSHQTISENLQSLQQMFRLLTMLQKQQNGEVLNPLEPWKITSNSSNRASIEPTLLPSESLNNGVIEIPEEDSTLDDLLSLDDLDVSDGEAERVNEEEDWGDLLEDDDSEILTLDGLDFADSERLQEETEFIANTSLENIDRSTEDRQ